MVPKENVLPISDQPRMQLREQALASLKTLDISGDRPFLPTLHKVLALLPEQRQSLPSATSGVFSGFHDHEAETELTVHLFRHWHLYPESSSLTALCLLGLDLFAPDATLTQLKALLAASVLGEMPNDLPYHNNIHYRKVLLQTLRMVRAHNDTYKGTAKALTADDIVLLMIAACIHDLGHDGHGNTVRGVWEQGKLERQAYDIAVPYLLACGFDKPEELERLRVMILCTDVTPVGDPASAAAQMKAAYRHHFMGFKGRFQSLNLDANLKRLETDADLILMSLLLHEADIATSAGLTYAVTAYETAALMEEIGQETAHPQHVMDFLNLICQRQMLSIAGQELFAANMARIHALTEEAIAAGNHAYPKAELSPFISGSGAGKPLH